MEQHQKLQFSNIYIDPNIDVLNRIKSPQRNEKPKSEVM